VSLRAFGFFLVVFFKIYLVQHIYKEREEGGRKRLDSCFIILVALTPVHYPASAGNKRKGEGRNQEREQKREKKGDHQPSRNDKSHRA
jgi:hypothetical protein